MKILTDYIILKRQCPLWEQHTHNVRNLKYLDTDLMKSGEASRGTLGLVSSIFESTFINALKLYWRRNSYNIIITGDLWVGLYYSFLCKVFSSRKIPHLHIDFLLDQHEHAHPLWKIKRALQKYLLSEMDCILVYSQAELDTYASALDIEPKKFMVIPYHTNITEPKKISSDKGYLFSAGRSGRDYQTLIKAVTGLDIEVIIVSDYNSMRGIEVPSNVKVYYNVSYDNYLELLKGAKAVILTLTPHIRSLGKVVMLEAMAFGKPVISTHSVSIATYIKTGENGFLLDSGDFEGIREKINYLLENPAECDRIAHNALNDVLEYWTFEKYVQRVLNIAQELAGKGATCH